MVKYHKLNNLIWIWSVDRPSQPGREFVKYYPGTKYLDILAIDIYGNDFNQSYYDGLKDLSEGKPITLGEVGNPPSNEVLSKQPDWVYWVVWAGMTRGTSLGEYEKLLANPHVVFMEDAAYLKGTAEYRKACGFETLKLNRKADFTGEWRLSETESEALQNMGQVTPYKLIIDQGENKLTVKSYSVVEWADDEIAEQSLTLDGKDNKSTGFMNSPRIQTANWSPERDTLTIASRITMKFGEKPPIEMKSKEVWALQKRGRKLMIIQTSEGMMGRGPVTTKLVYDKY
jgi:hypothetical protein